MSLPQNMEPEEPPVVEPELASEEVTPAEDVSAEDASDAQLRQWAKDNDIEGVPANGRLSASWREQITNAMAAALDPKEEDSAKDTSSSEVETKPEPPVVEYRSVFEPPNTFVSSQMYTA